MKKSANQFVLMLIITLAFLAIIQTSWAQAPQKMSYQAVIRNSSSQLVANQKVGMRISILKGSENGTAVYTETQNPTTNANGLVTVEIGTGTTSDNFSAIDWATGPYYITTETDISGGTNYSINGVSQLLSVPYALYAKNVENDKVDDADADPANEIQVLSKTGNIVSLSKDGGSVTVDDADADPANEIQSLSLSGTNLSLSKGGGTVTLPSSGGGDNWGAQSAVTDATLSGNGLTAIPLKIAQQSATTGQALKWNGTTWKPGKVDSDSTNEIQELNLSGSNLSLSKGGGTVTLPSSGGGLTLPFVASASYSTTPFSVENKGTAWYSIAGYSDNGHGIYGKTKASNGTGVFGVATGANISTGVLGQAGDYPTPILFGNVGVLGQSNANYAVAGTTFSGTGGYFSSETGFALNTIGKVKLTGIGEAAGRVLTSDGSGNATWQNAAGGGLTLPFNGSTSDANTAFQITNNGTGEGIKSVAVSSGKTGIIGEAPNQGISGNATATSGAAYGVQGTSASSTGSGVTGYGSSSTGLNFGVRGLTLSSEGKGVFGYAASGSGVTYGIYGESLSNEGYGVFGTSNNIGVYGDSPWIGVKGYARGSGGSTGVYGSSESVNGYGVYGTAPKYGVYGYSESADGYGVFGASPNIAVYGNSPLGWAGYFDGRLAVNGRVGIGTFTPSYPLEIDGQVNSSIVHFVNNVTGRIADDGLIIGVNLYGNSIITNYEPTDLLLGTNGSSDLIIDNNHNIGIGVFPPQYKLDVAGEANLIHGTSGVALRCSGAEAIWFNGDYYSWGFGGNYNYFARPVAIESGYAGTGYSLSLGGNAIKTGGANWATWSDIRLKDIHGNYEKGLKEIKLLQPVTYSYKEGNARKLPSDQTYVGFIAQDVQKVFPEAVSEDKEGYLSLDVNSINVALVNAIKELKAENDQLNDRLSKLEKILEANGLK